MKPAGVGRGVFRPYLEQIRRLAVQPAGFFESVFNGDLPSEGSRFVYFNGLVLAALFFLLEAVSGGRVTWVLLLAAFLSLAVLPFLLEGAARLWGAYLVTSARMLHEPLDPVTARRVSEYSTAGLLPLAFGNGWVSLLALSVIGFQVVGLEKGLSCSRFRAAVLAGFPFVLFLTVVLLVMLIFKTRVF
jgi:hypothetical protein